MPFFQFGLRSVFIVIALAGVVCVTWTALTPMTYVDRSLVVLCVILGVIFVQLCARASERKERTRREATSAKQDSDCRVGVVPGAQAIAARGSRKDDDGGAADAAMPKA
jgi:hypothetical protein